MSTIASLLNALKKILGLKRGAEFKSRVMLAPDYPCSKCGNPVYVSLTKMEKASGQFTLTCSCGTPDLTDMTDEQLNEFISGLINGTVKLEEVF